VLLKSENARLKQEVDTLKKQLANKTIAETPIKGDGKRTHSFAHMHTHKHESTHMHSNFCVDPILQIMLDIFILTNVHSQLQ